MRSVFDVEEQDYVAHDGEVSNDLLVAAAGFVFKEDGVFTPMVSYFTACPVVPDNPQPLFGAVFVRVMAAQVIGIFPCLRLGTRLAANMNNGAHMREPELHGFDRFDGNAALGQPAMRLLELFKKGGSPAMPACASLCTVS